MSPLEIDFVRTEIALSEATISIFYSGKLNFNKRTAWLRMRPQPVLAKFCQKSSILLIFFAIWTLLDTKIQLSCIRICRHQNRKKHTARLLHTRFKFAQHTHKIIITAFTCAARFRRRKQQQHQPQLKGASEQRPRVTSKTHYDDFNACCLLE